MTAVASVFCHVLALLHLQLTLLGLKAETERGVLNDYRFQRHVKSIRTTRKGRGAQLNQFQMAIESGFKQS